MALVFMFSPLICISIWTASVTAVAVEVLWVSVLWASKCFERNQIVCCYFKAKVCDLLVLKILSNMQIQESKAFADGFVSLAL